MNKSNKVTPDAAKVACNSPRKTFAELGRIMLQAYPADSLRSGYKMTELDPEWIGRQALSFGDINPDGTLN